ncbi:putative cleavage and polyadenylation specificity factor subunit 4-like protein [Oxyura jamaicensis]|uniref:putative cleavage and polyadenylation specificity factor subunit 4-like protein n=1 Tax=Oxyura jamaicensis TaxID=8884 RepID=UPI0015A50A56|nr:putative cleavage and polyadenylation specificity factor subunit 4-like protein [Oxyura jamaicensis]
MQELVAGVERLRFHLEADVEQQRGAQLLPLPGMWHTGTERAVVCKHWVRGLCKKGDGCGFLHGYDVTKMPECYSHAKLGECSNKDCPFLHTHATADSGACPWYDRGFCRHGPSCKYKHTRRVMCANYLVGFCPEGPKCKFMHVDRKVTTPASVGRISWKSCWENDLSAPARRGEGGHRTARWSQRDSQ